MPSADTTSPIGAVPVAIVGVARAVKSPVAVLRLYIDMLFEVRFAAYTDVPSADIAMPRGAVPVAIVGVVSAVKSPVEVLRLYIDKLFEFILAV